MLTLIEKIVFTFAVIVSGYFAYMATHRLINIISLGKGKPDWSLIPKQLWPTIARTISLQTVWRLRPIPSFFHGLVVWGFIYFLVVNLGDVLQAFLPNFRFLGYGTLGNLHRLGADLLSIGVLVGMVALLIRRFILRPEDLKTRKTILLHKNAQKGIKRDSLIVGGFILLHVGFRFLGESIQLALTGELDRWQPFASMAAFIWTGLSGSVLEILIHISFWIALGLILLFIPYFPYSKHIHLFFAPLNFLLKQEKSSIGRLNPLDFEDESIEWFGASTIEDLGWEQIMDAYACIMCFRCQQVCPAYETGKVLSPAALEINKRYYLNTLRIPKETSSPSAPLLEFAIPEEAIWACTACGACVDICPVGNEPMLDIIDIRRSLVLMENKFPEEWQTAFRGIERTTNPWNIPQTERLEWVRGLEVPTIQQNPNPEYLWWVGCAPATDARAQKSTRALAKILNHSGINYAILGEMETCTGDSARRAGNEYLFYELATANIELFNKVKPQKILTTCPHCLHTIMNEYPAFGGIYEVVHHSQLISELLLNGQLHLHGDSAGETVTFHDPCYLGRQNGIIKEPRLAIQQTGAQLVEMPNSGKKSFCCGAGGAQIWKEEESGETAVSATRFAEAQATGVDKLGVGCPFCMLMLNDAASDSKSEIEVLDIAEIVAAQLDPL
ncbi:(Fe-S)-binding protein [Chloroflexota bacterium]